MNSRTAPDNRCVSDSTPPHDTSHHASGTQSGLGNASVPPYTTGHERMVDDVARREQILAVQVKAHRFCIGQLAEERARFEAEKEAANARTADEAAARAREALAQERQEFEQWKTSESVSARAATVRPGAARNGIRRVSVASRSRTPAHRERSAARESLDSRAGAGFRCKPTPVRPGEKSGRFCGDGRRGHGPATSAC